METDVRKKAWKKVKRIKRFYLHACTFVIFGLFFFFMNMATDPFFMWFFFPMLPWAVLLAFHYLIVFGIPGSSLLSSEWEEREFERQMDLLDSEPPYSTHSEFHKGKYLPYTELSDEEALELRRIQKEGGKYFKEDFV